MGCHVKKRIGLVPERDKEARKEAHWSMLAQSEGGLVAGSGGGVAGVCVCETDFELPP